METSEVQPKQVANAYDMRSTSEDLGWLIFISFVVSIAVTVMSVSASLDEVDDESNKSTKEWTASFYYYCMPDDTYAEYEAVDHQPNFHELNKALRHYCEMATNIVKQLSLAHEVASRTEQLLFPNHATETKRCNASERSAPSFLSSKLEDKISKSAELLEKNMMVLESLLKEFPINIGPSPLHNAYSDDNLVTGNTFPPSLNNQQKLNHQMTYLHNHPLRDISHHTVVKRKGKMKNLNRMIQHHIS